MAIAAYAIVVLVVFASAYARASDMPISVLFIHLRFFRPSVIQSEFNPVNDDPVDGGFCFESSRKSP